LLCLTVSATLREKPLTISAEHPFLIYLKTLGADVSGHDAQAALNIPAENDDADDIVDLEEVNLLEGLTSGEYIMPFFNL
jgi:hypothetical protein